MAKFRIFYRNLGEKGHPILTNIKDSERKRKIHLNTETYIVIESKKIF